MNRHTSGAVLLLIIGLAGIQNGNPWAYGLAAVTAALAFVCADIEDVMPTVRTWLAVASWATTAGAFIALFIH